MALLPTQPEQFIKAQDELREQVQASSQVEVKNAAGVAELHSPQFLAFRGRNYVARHFPFQIGIELQHIQARITQMKGQEETRESLTELLALLEDAVALFRVWLQPTSWSRRLFWKWAKNPFVLANEQEVAELLGFFSRCRRRSTVEVRGSGRLRNRLLLIPTMRSAGSFERILAGLE